MVAKKELVEAHRPRWENVWAWLVLLAVYFSLQGLIIYAALAGQWWLALLLVLPLAHVMHAHLLALHEAAHGTLCPSRFWNELCGFVVGVHSFMSLSLFRHVHTTHHVRLTSERDEELWPFVLPGTPRWQRVLIAWTELVFGLYYTPVLFLRSLLRKDSTIRDPRVRRRIWLELAGVAVFVAAMLGLTAWFGAWKLLLVAYLIPAMLAGSLQTGRKYAEHMGLTGTTVLSATRSVVPRTRLGRLLSRTMFNIAYHGAHHRYAKMHPSELPRFQALLKPEREGELAPYPTYRRAFAEVLRSLSDPKIGAQWEASAGPGARVRLG